MKKIVFTAIAAIALFGTGCLKIKEKEVAPDFNVTVDKTTWAVGSTVTFHLSGNPDYITFFSGEQGLNYANLNRYNAAGTPKLQFTSARNAGTQANSLLVLVSSNFAGMGIDSATTAKNIAAATWTDITGRATLATSATAVASGAIDLSDFPADKPVYIAFRYLATTGAIQNKWTITGLTVTNTLADGSVYTIANLNSTAITNYGVATVFSPGWVPFRLNNTANWVVTAGTSLVVTGAATAATATVAIDDWAYSGGIVLNKVSNDVGTFVKESSARLASNDYTYTFKTAGTYVVTFTAANASVYGNEEVVKQITLTIQ
ncbi:DUF5017 domain-containing protein [Mucilaginibacter gracilis]|nr:DUF5017 domain-containing protein [Mucilaginibacter gracilis]